MLFWQYEEDLTAVLYGVAEISQFNHTNYGLTDNKEMRAEGHLHF